MNTKSLNFLSNIGLARSDCIMSYRVPIYMSIELLRHSSQAPQNSCNMEQKTIASLSVSPDLQILVANLLILVHFIACLFIFGFLFTYFCRRQKRTNEYNGVPGGDHDLELGGLVTYNCRVPPPPPYLMPQPILPPVILSYKRHESNATYKECVICSESFKEGEWSRELPACGHVFHPDCIKEWLVNNPTCPICRAPTCTCHE